MYLSRLYRHNKILFLLIVLFAFAQLGNNIRQDIAISPLYSYGMYSEVIKPKSLYIVPEIFVNGKQLQTKDFTPMEWENISFPVTQFYRQKEWNNEVWKTDIHRLLPFTDSSKFANALTEMEFRQWYKRHLQSILTEHIDSTAISFSTYAFDGETLHKLNSAGAHEQ